MPTETKQSAVAHHAAQFTTETIERIDRITDGSINETFEVTVATGDRFILQRMSPLFKPYVMDNLALVEPLAAGAGVVIPHGIKTITGNPYIVNSDGAWYRALTYIPGVTIHKDISVTAAESAGLLVAKFHSALADCEEKLVEAIPHFHDTHYYLDKMVRVAAESDDEKKRATLSPIVAEITQEAQGLDTDVRQLPQRIIHADLKVSNIRFNDAGEAVALIDMDTLMRGSIVTEMGDALRSWCGTAGEDSPNQVFDEKICQAALSGYASAAAGITDEEVRAIPEGIRILTLELAARFVTDAYEERYFAKSSLYPSLYEQNKTKAENQLRFLKAYDLKKHLVI